MARLRKQVTELTLENEMLRHRLAKFEEKMAAAKRGSGNANLRPGRVGSLAHSGLNGRGAEKIRAPRTVRYCPGSKRDAWLPRTSLGDQRLVDQCLASDIILEGDNRTAIPNGGRLQARVSNACEWSGQQRRGLRVTFADNGCGIPSQNLHRIFEPSFTTKGTHGSGLGLGLVMTVVRKHKGSLHVRSSTQCGHSGSIFSVFLPAAHVPGSAA